MSLKENVEYIKEEVSAQESFLENFLKVEKFWNKYKKVIISFGVLAVVAVIANSTLSYMAEQTKLEANEAFNKVLENPNDKDALATLEKTNKKLYDIALYMQDNKKDTNVEFVKEISAYAKAIEAKDIKAISTLTQNTNFLQKDFAILNKAILQIEAGDIKGAKESLKLIPLTSNVSQLVKLVEHYLMVK